MTECFWLAPVTPNYNKKPPAKKLGVFILDRAAIPESMKKYTSELLAGIAASNRRRIELSNAWGYTPRTPDLTAYRPAAAAALRPSRQVQLNDHLPSQSVIHAAAAGLQAVKFWPLVGISATRRGHGGAWRVYELAKHLDKPGRGAIPLDELNNLAKELHIHKKTWRRWMDDAAALGLWQYHPRRTGEVWLVLINRAAAAALLGCEEIGTRPTTVKACSLVAAGWVDIVWAAYESTFEGRPVTRAMQEKLSGVPISTQRYHDKRASVDRHHNIVVSDLPADQLDGVKEYIHRAAFIFVDKRHRARVAWPTADSRTTDAAESLQRGRSRKIRKALERMQSQQKSDLSKKGQVLAFSAGYAKPFRVFHMTGQQLRTTERRLAQNDVQNASELYLHHRYGKRADLWRVVPLGERFS